MQPLIKFSRALAAGLLLLPAAGLAIPVSADSESESQPSAQPSLVSSAEDIALAEPRLETSLEALAPESEKPRTASRNRVSSLARNYAELLSGPDQMLNLGMDGGLGTTSVREALRGFVNVQRAEPGQRRAGPTRRGSPDMIELDLFPELREWIQGAVHDVVNTVLQPEFNQNGRVSFSVLGHGDFSVDLSADRNQLALRAGEDVLLTAERTPPRATSVFDNTESQVSARPVPDLTQNVATNPLREILDEITDAASHPIAYIVYAIGLAYALLWSVMSRTRKPFRDRDRRSTTAHAVAGAPPHSNRERKKIRMRVRTRRQR